MHIYLFINKTNGKFYVGQSIHDPDKRFKQHRVVAANEKTRHKQPISLALHKYGWDGFSRHVLEVLQTQEELNSAETYWISYYESMGPKGYNLTTGGGSSGKRSDETKERMSLSKRGKNLGRKFSEESIRKLREANLGKTYSDEVKKRMSEGKLGMTHSDEAKANMSRARLGFKPSEETRKKLSEAQLGKKHSAATKIKISEEQRKNPRHRSEELKAKMAEGARLYWEQRRAEKAALQLGSDD